MKILVTGSQGKLGAYVVPALQKYGHEVVSYDLQCGQNLFARHTLREAMRGCEQIVHLAGIPGPVPGTPFYSFFDANCEGTYAVARAAVEGGVRRLVYSGSTAFYGVEPGIPYRSPVSEETPPITCTAKASELTCTIQHLGYDISKIIAEQILAYYGLTKAMEVVILRFGPLKTDRGCTLEIAAAAICKAVQHPGPFWYEVFNIIEGKFPWAISYKAQAILGLELYSPPRHENDGSMEGLT